MSRSRLTIWEHAQSQGYSRRDFMQFCTWLAAADRHRSLRGRAGRPRARDEAAPAGRVVPLPGVHLLQRVVHPVQPPDRRRHRARQDLARLHRDAAGGRRQAGGRGAARDDDEVQRRVPDARRRLDADRGGRHLLLHRRADRARHRAGGGQRRQGDRRPGAAARRTAASRPRSRTPPARRPSTRSSRASRSSTCRAARRSPR